MEPCVVKGALFPHTAVRCVHSGSKVNQFLFFVVVFFKNTSLLAPLLCACRPGFPEERGVPRSHENYDYEGRELRRPAAYPGGHGGYEEEVRRAPPPARYRDEYDQRY